MATLNFSKKNIENNENDNTELNQNKSIKIILDDNQLDYIKFRLNFSDGFMFGLGVAIALIVIFILIFSLLAIMGFSFYHFFINPILHELM